VAGTGDAVEGAANGRGVDGPGGAVEGVASSRSMDGVRDRLAEQNSAARKAFEENVMVKCQFCQRSFLPDRIAIHNRSCTAERPSRRVGERSVGMIGPFKNRNFNVPGVAGHQVVGWMK